jgi:Sulfotransferase family
MLIELAKKIKVKFIPTRPTIIKLDKGILIFVHINKTAGTSVSKVIGVKKVRHLTVKDIINQIGFEKWNSAYKFSIVRNPWDKVVSQYKYRERTNQTGMGKRKIGFNDWVQKTLGENKDRFYYDEPKMFLPQVEWLKNYSGEIELNEIFRFENLNATIGKLSEVLGFKVVLPHLNKTPGTPYKEFYNEKTVEIVADWYKEDLDFFGYKFGD